MANRYWIGGSGNWSDPSHWSTTSGGTWDASVPTSADDVFFDASSHLGPELILNNTFDDTSWWDLSEATISSGAAHVNTTGNGWKVYKTDLYTSGNNYKGRYEIKNYSSGEIALYSAPNRSANGTYNETFTASTTTAGFLAQASTILDIDNVYVREVRSLNVNLDISANCRSMDWSTIEASAQITSAVNSAYIYGDLTLNPSLYWRFSGNANIYIQGDTSLNITQNNAPRIIAEEFYVYNTATTTFKD